RRRGRSGGRVRVSHPARQDPAGPRVCAAIVDSVRHHGDRKDAVARRWEESRRMSEMKRPYPEPQPAATEGVLIEFLLKLPREPRHAMVVLVHLALTVAASYLAFSLRFDGTIPGNYVRMFARTLPWLLLARGATFIALRLDEGIWRYV